MYGPVRGYGDIVEVAKFPIVLSGPEKRNGTCSWSLCGSAVKSDGWDSVRRCVEKVLGDINQTDTSWNKASEKLYW